MGNAKVSAILLIVLGVLVVVCAVGIAVSEWEWWTLLLVLSSMAFVAGLVLFLAREVGFSCRRSGRGLSPQWPLPPGA
jgi:heme/copper-type cytochrome/quinol oxidase subunit 2